MTQKEKAVVREAMVERVRDMFVQAGEDTGMIAGGTINMPVVIDGIEAWVEVKVSVPSYDKEGDPDAWGYQMREDYAHHKAEVQARADERHAKAQAKAQADAERRAAKAQAKA